MVPAPDQPVDIALAAVLRRLRTERGLSQEATAHRAGIALNSYSRIETGQASPSWPTVRQIALALDVSLADLGSAVEGYQTPR
jgi:transcriptional regulator with XRE-family HTH domain